MLVDRLFRMFEKCREVHADAFTRVELDVNAYRVIRIHVLGLHEPALLVTADRKNRAPEFFPPVMDLPDEASVRAVAREIYIPRWAAYHESGPERFVRVEQSPPGVVERRNAGDGKNGPGKIRILPPVELPQIGARFSGNGFTDADTGDYERIVSPYQRVEGGDIAMVVMIVADEDDVDLPHGIESARVPRTAMTTGLTSRRF